MSPGLDATFSRRYPTGTTIEVENLSASKAGVTILFGPSGAGKSTVLRSLAGVDRPDTGRILFNQVVWFDSLQRIHIPPRERNIGFVPQQYGLFPHLSVAANIAYGIRDLPAKERRRRLEETMALLAIEALRTRIPATLSGGEQQRVALARAVVRQPLLLLLDEPLAALDVPLRRRIRSELRHWLLELGIPCVVVTHDRSDALALGDDMVVLDSGKIVQTGPVQDVFCRPAHLSVAGILSVETIQAGQILSIADGLIAVQVGPATLHALEQAVDREGRQFTPQTQGAIPQIRDVYVCIRAEDVILAKDKPQHSSARNCLPGTVRSLVPEGMTVRIELDCGFPLTAMLTKQASAELGLRPNESVYALVKAPHIQLISREPRLNIPPSKGEPLR